MTPEQKNAAFRELVEITNLRPGGTVTVYAQREIDIAPAEIAAMLREAGAPEPWHHARADKIIADEITCRWPEPPKRARSAQDRAEGAIGALRRALPILITDSEAWVKSLERGWPPVAPSIDPADEALWRNSEAIWLAYARRELAKWERLRDALPTGRRFARLPKPWHCDAWTLFVLYRTLIYPKTGMSAGGPAVRFVTAMLDRMGHGTREPAAITKALGEWRQKIARREKSPIKDS